MFNGTATFEHFESMTSLPLLIPKGWNRRCSGGIKALYLLGSRKADKLHPWEAMKHMLGLSKCALERVQCILPPVSFSHLSSYNASLWRRRKEKNYFIKNWFPIYSVEVLWEKWSTERDTVTTAKGILYCI